MKCRDSRTGRYVRAPKSNKVGMYIPLIALAVIGTMYTMLVADAYIEPDTIVVEQYHEWEDRVVLIEAQIEWSEDRIIEEIKKTFPEHPDLMVEIAKCESRLNPNAVGPTNDYGLLQIHDPSWGSVAEEKGLKDYKTDVLENLVLAKHIYETQGLSAWVCYDII